MREFLICIFISSVPIHFADGSTAIPGSEQTTPVALVGGTVHPVASTSIENGTILFADGRITAIGEHVTLPEDAVQVDVSGQHIYPGLFNAGGQLGLVEINAVRATVDDSELGSINPNVRAETAVNPDSELIPVTRSNGVLLCLTVPTGGLVSGASAILQLDGWTWEDLTLKSRAGVHVYWPRMRFGDDSNQNRNDQIKRLEDLVERAKDYRKVHHAADNAQNPKIDLKLEALIPVLNRNVPIVVHADRVGQIQAAVAFASSHNLRLIIYGGYDAAICARLLRENDVPVVISNIYRLPLRRSEPYDSAYTLPDRLRQAGVKYCIAGVDRFGASNLRNLPYNAATAAAYGLPQDEALKSITLYPAQIFGIDDEVGSLEVGKRATLFVCDGNPLETATNVKIAYINGRKLDLNDRHKTLWQKYRRKYRDLGVGR